MGRIQWSGCRRAVTIAGKANIDIIVSTSSTEFMYDVYRMDLLAVRYAAYLCFTDFPLQCCDLIEVEAEQALLVIEGQEWHNFSLKRL